LNPLDPERPRAATSPSVALSFRRAIPYARRVRRGQRRETLHGESSPVGGIFGKRDAESGAARSLRGASHDRREASARDPAQVPCDAARTACGGSRAARDPAPLPRFAKRTATAARRALAIRREPLATRRERLAIRRKMVPPPPPPQRARRASTVPPGYPYTRTPRDTPSEIHPKRPKPLFENWRCARGMVTGPSFWLPSSAATRCAGGGWWPYVQRPRGGVGSPSAAP